MNLHEALRTLPPDLVMHSHLDGRQMSVAEWLTTYQDEPGVGIGRNRRNYGREEVISIYFDKAGVLLSQV